MSENIKKEWEAYCERELAIVRPMLFRLGFSLDVHQPHIGGERYLMQAITTASGKKLILLGRAISDGTRVVIKTTNDTSGMKEISHERNCRDALSEMKFAYNVFFTPEEMLFVKKNGRMIFIQKFIEQECAFLARPIAEQFDILLKSFKAQEGARAVTREHLRFARKNFGATDADGYRQSFGEFAKNILDACGNDDAMRNLFLRAEKLLTEEKKTIEQYGGFLAHIDFVPHNIRVAGGNIYLLDHSALRFGNKYEGWARCINFMELYNPPLARALVEYVRNNRTSEETLSLRLMRVYRLGEIIWYYEKTLSKSAGDLLTLNRARVAFWTSALGFILDDKLIPLETIEEYKRIRDSLRSDEEKDRQKDLH